MRRRHRTASRAEAPRDVRREASHNTEATRMRRFRRAGAAPRTARGDDADRNHAPPTADLRVDEANHRGLAGEIVSEFASVSRKVGRSGGA